METTLRTFSVLVDDEPGVLSQISRLFSRKGFNIESLAVGPTEEHGLSRLTLEVLTDDQQTELLCNQLSKMVPVHSARLLAEYFGGGTIADGVAAMNAQVEELGLAHTHFSNPHGISDDDHYTSCYDMAQILRWALQQPGFEDLFTRNEMYTMQPTNIQPVTRYFSQQDKIRIGSSRYHIDSVLGSKLGYTNTARYSYVCLAEQDGVRLICATMQRRFSRTVPTV